MLSAMLWVSMHKYGSVRSGRDLHIRLPTAQTAKTIKKNGSSHSLFHL